MDLKTRYNRGYAYINFTDPLFILDFYLEFQGFRWNERFKDCHSTKVSKPRPYNFPFTVQN